MYTDVQPLQLNCFNCLLELQYINFPLPGPVPTEFWTREYRHHRLPIGKLPAGDGAVNVKGWVLHVPGLLDPILFLRESSAKAYHRYLNSHLKARSYLSEFEGDLYDHRTGGKRLLRKDYKRFFPRIKVLKELISTLRAVPSLPFKESTYFLTYSDERLCPHCVKENLKEVAFATHCQDGSSAHVVACGTHDEDDTSGPLTCDSCDRVIRPAFGGIVA